MPESKRPFEIDDLFRFQYVTDGKLSPDGKKAVYVLMTQDTADQKEYSALWLVDIESGQHKQLTGGKWSDTFPAWSPSGERIAFISTRAGVPQVHIMRLDGGESQPVTSLAQGCQGPLLWKPDGSGLIFTASPESPPDTSKPYRMTRPIFRLDGVGNTDAFVKSIYWLDLSAGNVERLTDDGWDHTPVNWSPDGSELLVQSILSPDTFSIFPRLSALNLKGEMRSFPTEDWILFNARWLADGRIAFIGWRSESRKYLEKGDLWVMNQDGTNLECRTAALELGVGGGMHDDVPVPWSLSMAPMFGGVEASGIITNVQNGGMLEIHRVALSGAENVPLLAGGKRACYLLSAEADKILFGMSTPFDPTQLAVVDMKTGREKILTDFNRELLAQIEMPTLENIHFKSSDGTPVEGWIMKPKGEAPFPTVLHIHGGPYVGYGYVFFFDFLALTSAGYAVLFINHRGSTGYGTKFSSGSFGNFGHWEFEDFMAAVDHAIALGVADPERLGICGISAGGFATTWTIGHTDRFKAAVPENPVTDWFSFYGTSDIGEHYPVWVLGGKPHEIPDVYLKCSPILYAHNCKTPTLLVQGEADYRCPAGQSEEFYTILKANGCIAEMLRMPASGHNDSTYGSFETRKAHNEALIDWMNRYLKP
jgi:dipeptidyl aminopeptidase/acylaminoacyl peptidase